MLYMASIQSIEDEVPDNNKPEAQEKEAWEIF